MDVAVDVEIEVLVDDVGGGLADDTVLVAVTVLATCGGVAVDGELDEVMVSTCSALHTLSNCCRMCEHICCLRYFVLN